MRRPVRGITALLVLVVLMLGAPLALATWVGNPWPPGGWAEVQLLSHRAIYGGVAVIGWLAWAQLAGCVVVEIAAALKSVRERGLLDTVTRTGGAGRVAFATGGQQQLARLLVTWVAALGVGTSAVPSTAPASAGTSASAPATETIARVAGDVAKEGPIVVTTGHTTVWRLAETHLGDGREWRKLLDLNRGTTMADGTVLADATQPIPAGTTIELPAGAIGQGAGRSSLASRHTATVRDGEYLSLIAEREMGDGNRWPELYRANRALIGDDPDLIHPGQRLAIPGTARHGAGADTDHGQAQHTQTPTPSEKRHKEPPPHQRPTPPDISITPEQRQPSEQAEVPSEATPSPQATPKAPEAGTRAVTGDDSALAAPWILAGLTGGGVLLAGSLLLGLRQRRRAQFRARRPGRGIPLPDPELVPVERTVIAAGDSTAATVAFMDAALKRVASAAHATATPMPALAAVELVGDRLTLHLSEPTDLSPPWQGSSDRVHWHCATHVRPADLGPEPGHVEAPYPMLVTIGESDTGAIWLVNCEELGTIAVTGDEHRSRDFARHLTAQLAVNPWSDAVEVDCVGIAAEAADLAGRVRYHDPGHDGDLTTAAITADAVASTDRATRYATDVATARTGQVDDDAWSGRMLVVDGAVEAPEGLQDLIDLVSGQRGRTATSIVIAGSHHRRGVDQEIEVTSSGRVVLDFAGLNLKAVGLTSDETRGCVQLYAQSEVLDDVSVRVDQTAAEGWEAYADSSGALRAEYTLPRSAPADALGKGSTSILDAPDEDYVREAAVVPEDLETVAPRVTAEVRERVEQSDPTLDDDVAAWFSKESRRPRLSLLGPISARAFGKPMVDRKPYFTELLAFLALHRRHGVTRDDVCDAFGIEPGVVRNYIKIVRAWLGTKPGTEEPYLPNADQSPASLTRGVNVYQVDEDLLVDFFLFKRLVLRGRARGGAEGQRDLITALRLVEGPPFSQERRGGWNWLAEGHRHDHEITMAIADTAFIVATHHMETGELGQARAAAELAVLAAPYEEATRLCLVRVHEAEGDRRGAETMLRHEVCNRSDDGGPPAEPNQRTATIVDNKRWLAG